MKTIPLKQFIDQATQKKAAEGLGLTQGAIWQAVRDERDIHVVVSNEVIVDAFENKPFGNKTKK